MTSIKYTLRFLIWLIIYVIPTMSLFNNTKFESGQDLSFLQHITEFAHWEKQNLYQRPVGPPKPQLKSINLNKTESFNSSFTLPIVKQFFNSSKLVNTSIFEQTSRFRGDKKAPHWTVSTGLFADKLKEWNEEEEECFMPIKEIPQRRPKKYKPRKKYVRPVPPPRPQKWSRPNYWSFTSEEDSFSDWWSSDCSESDWSSDDGGKLWFLGMNVAQEKSETTQISIIPSRKLVTRVNEQFYNTYRSNFSNNDIKKRNLDDSYDEYFGFDNEIQSRITNNLLKKYVESNVLNSKSTQNKILSKWKLKLLVCLFALHTLYYS